MMTTLEKRTTVSVAIIFFSRMMGLFMVLPVLSLYGLELQGASVTLLGLAIGIYGFTQAIFQIPLSMLSDRIGRKNVMLVGLSLFVLGSICAALANDIWSLIASRCLQGAGAIAGTSLALLGDVSSVKNRNKVMAAVGITIGASFVIALVAGPWLAGHVGLSGLFYSTTVLAIVALLVCWLGIPRGLVMPTHAANMTKESAKNKLKSVFQNERLMILAFAVLVLHLVMTGSFVALPIILEGTHHLARETHWKVYLGVFLVALLFMGPFMRSRPKRRGEGINLVLVVALSIMIFSLASIALLFENYYFLLALLCFYFTSFNLLEAVLPSQMSLEVSDHLRATAMGVFSTLQFLGAFIGGVLGGYFIDHFSYRDLLFVMSGLAVLVLFFYWFFVVNTEKKTLLLS
jgi:MFS family permease